MTDLPNPDPRPVGELERLRAAWMPPRIIVTEVNNTTVGIWYVAAAMLFFVLAGSLGLLIRAQLIVPTNNLVSQDLYNQVFTVHGTAMMFLFAVPAVEAIGILLLPQMLGARDLPFPRLSAFAFWAYAIGSIAFFASLLFGVAPRGGWFMYPPLTDARFSPGIDPDFYLLGIGFIEISAIAGAIEIICGVLKTRAPGMRLDILPLFGWAMLIFSGMIVFAFPPLILATLLLEIERAFSWPFFVAEKGGDPLLWQHLFWFFGHPEVYIIFLPAAGMVSMILPTMARHALVGYRLLVVAIVATGFFSFGLWVHHMFATGVPQLSLGLFSAASMAVAIPSGIQVFSWIATISAGRLRLTTPSVFVLGAIFIFTVGGLTGVMVALVPFDWQVHDTYFVVAHFHYVLAGGLLFPFFAAFYYWTPSLAKRQLSEQVGYWVCGLMFLGFNVAFLPMHLTGLRGMPRRVWTYPSGLGWDTLNLISTIGAAVLAAGILLFLVDVSRSFRLARDRPAGNVWGAGTLEWLSQDHFAARSVPIVQSRDPLWHQPNLAQDVEAGNYYLPGTITGARETLVTSPVDATPQYLHILPGPGWPPLLAAIFTAAFFLLLTVKLPTPALLCGVVAIASILVWTWGTDPGTPQQPADIGGGVVVPIMAAGTASIGWWATAVLCFVAASQYLAFAFSYLYLWTVAPGDWAGVGGADLPNPGWPALSVALASASFATVDLARRLTNSNRIHMAAALLIVAPIAILAALVLDTSALVQTGLRPTESGYAAIVYANTALNAQLFLALAIMAAYTVARIFAGRLTADRCVTLDCLWLLWAYTTGQFSFSLALVHGFPRLVG